METLQLFEDCLKKKTTVKEAFKCLGLTNVAMQDKSFKELDEEVVFACIMHWIIHTMDKRQSIKLRFRVEDKVYQVKMKYYNRQLRVAKLDLITKDGEGFILYDWMEETTFKSLTKEKIQQGMKMADSNYNKQEHEETFEYDVIDVPVEITEADMELIDEFLNV